MLPGSNLGFELLLGGDAPVEALAAQDRKLDFDHVEPAGVLGGVVEFQASQNASGFGGRECLVEGGGGVRNRQDDADEAIQMTASPSMMHDRQRK